MNRAATGNGHSIHQNAQLEAGGEKEHDEEERLRLPLGQWIAERMDWSWFTCTQSTGGIAVILSECPKQFAGLQTIGVVIFIFNLVLFLTFSSLMLYRWISKPSTIRKSLEEMPEAYYIGSFYLTTATIIICIQRFGVPHSGPWLIVVVRVLFWLYAAVTVLAVSVQFVVMFKHYAAKAIAMNPAWFLMVFQAMLTGTTASAIAMDQPPDQRLPIIVAGIAFQGFGWIASLLVLVWFFGHLMETGWPAPSQSPGLFMPIGSVGFTIVALIGNAQAIPEGYKYFASHPTAPEVLLIMATWIGVFMWLFGFWLFAVALFVSLAQVLQRKNGRWTLPMTFNNSWWALIFPNVGFTLATAYLGQQLGSNAVQWVSVIMIILLVFFWLFDLFLMGKTIAMSLFIDSRHKLL